MAKLDEGLTEHFLEDQQHAKLKFKKEADVREDSTLSTQYAYNTKLLEDSSLNDNDLPFNLQNITTTQQTDHWDTKSTTEIRDTFIMQYRKITNDIDVASALEEIVNETINTSNSESPNPTLGIVQNNLKGSSGTIKKLADELNVVLGVLNYNKKAYAMFERFVTDGMLIVENIFDNAKLSDGVKHIRFLSPFGFTKYREVVDDEVIVGYKYDKRNDSALNDEEMLFDIGLVNRESSEELVFKEEQISMITNQKYLSFDFKEKYNIPVGYLHPVMKFVEGKNNIEQSIALYRFLYLFPRYAISVPLGNMNKTKSENYIASVKAMLKDDISFDFDSYSLKGMSSLETIRNHYVLPTRNGEQVGIDQVMGGDTGFLQDMEDLDFFIRRIYIAMNIPQSRLDESSSFDFSGRDILYQEKKFARKIDRLKNQFGSLLLDILKKHAIAKGIVTDQEFEDILPYLFIKFPLSDGSKDIFQNANRDAFVEQLESYATVKESGLILNDKAMFSLEYVMKKIFDIEVHEIDDQLKLIEKEKTKYKDHYEEEEEDEDSGGRFR